MQKTGSAALFVKSDVLLESRGRLADIVVATLHTSLVPMLQEL